LTSISAFLRIVSIF